MTLPGVCMYVNYILSSRTDMQAWVKGMYAKSNYITIVFEIWKRETDNNTNLEEGETTGILMQMLVMSWQFSNSLKKQIDNSQLNFLL